jgi:hypothetical protein
MQLRRMDFGMAPNGTSRCREVILPRSEVRRKAEWQ